MLVATITEAKNGLSALIDRVKGGESVLIVDRGRPVARLESAVGADAEGRLARLQRTGTVRAADRKPAADVFASPPARPARGASALAALLDERRGGR